MPGPAAIMNSKDGDNMSRTATRIFKTLAEAEAIVEYKTDKVFYVKAPDGKEYYVVSSNQDGALAHVARKKYGWISSLGNPKRPRRTKIK